MRYGLLAVTSLLLGSCAEPSPPPQVVMETAAPASPVDAPAVLAPPGPVISETQEGHTLELKASTVRGVAPLQVQLTARVVGGPDESEAFYCRPIWWHFGDGEGSGTTASCPGPPPGTEPETPHVTREHSADRLYAVSGQYEAQVFVGVRPGDSYLTSSVTITVE